MLREVNYSSKSKPDKRENSEHCPQLVSFLKDPHTDEAEANWKLANPHREVSLTSPSSPGKEACRLFPQSPTKRKTDSLWRRYIIKVTIILHRYQPLFLLETTRHAQRQEQVIEKSRNNKSKRLYIGIITKAFIIQARASWRIAPGHQDL